MLIKSFPILVQNDFHHHQNHQSNNQFNHHHHQLLNNNNNAFNQIDQQSIPPQQNQQQQRQHGQLYNAGGQVPRCEHCAKEIRLVFMDQNGKWGVYLKIRI